MEYPGWCLAPGRDLVRKCHKTLKKFSFLVLFMENIFSYNQGIEIIFHNTSIL